LRRGDERGSSRNACPSEGIKVIKKIVLIVAALGALLGVLWVMSGGNNKALPRTEAVKRGDIVDSVTATGRVNPVVSVSVGTQITGIIQKIHVDYNDTVKKGQVLIELDREVFESRLVEAEAEVRALGAELRRTEAEFKRDEAEFKRIEGLYEKGYISTNEFDAARYNLESLKASLDSGAANMARAEASLEEARENLRKTTITSPMDGVVLSKDVEEGQTVSASLQAPTLLTLGDLGEMEVHANVDEADIGRVHVGQRVLFNVDSYPEREFEGSVFKTYYSPKIEQNVVTYDVLVRVRNEELLLRPGMTANVRVIINEKEGVLIAPNRALRVRMPGVEAEGAGGPSVWVLEKGGPSRRPVKIGLGDSENFEVLDGLKEGDKVLVEAPKEEEKRSLGFRRFH
jgi:HlyD family secretion protein